MANCDDIRIERAELNRRRRRIRNLRRVRDDLELASRRGTIESAIFVARMRKVEDRLAKLEAKG